MKYTLKTSKGEVLQFNSRKEMLDCQFFLIGSTIYPPLPEGVSRMGELLLDRIVDKSLNDEFLNTPTGVH